MIAMSLEISGAKCGGRSIDSTNLKISENFAIIILESERGNNYEFKLLEIRFNTRERVSCTL